jgi:lipoprotein-releasing system permease protein
MPLPLLIAWRYLFAKKSTNAINVITGISVIGLSVGSAALILVLSVFNGFEGLLIDLMNSMNADIKVTPAKGKTFTVDSTVLADIRALPGVASVSLTLEEKALLEYDGKQDFCTLKGIDDHYNVTTTIEDALIEGDFKLHEQQFQYLIVGGGIANRLDINMEDPFEPVNVYMPRRLTAFPSSRPFKKRLAYPRAKFSIKQDYDYAYAFSSLAFMRELLGKPGEASAIEIDAAPGVSERRLKKTVQKVVGSDFVARDRYEQDAALFRLMTVEKWMSFAIAGLTLVIVSFNLIGALWMIVLDKKHDLSVLRAMGATAQQVRDVVLWEGLLVSGVGVLTGTILAVVIFLLQKNFGIISVPQGFVVDAYPIMLRLQDFVVVGAVVLIIGFVASILPARKGSLIPAFIREE